MSKRVLQFFDRHSDKLMLEQAGYKMPAEEVDKMGWGKTIRFPAHEFCFVRLGVIVGRLVGCDFSCPPPEGGFGFSNRGRFFGTKHDRRLARKTYIRFGKAIMWAGEGYREHLLKKGKSVNVDHVVREYRKKMVERLGSMTYMKKIRTWNDPEMEGYSRVQSRHYKSNINKVYALMEERDKKK